MILLGLLISSVVGLSLLYPRFIDNRAGFLLMVPVIAYTAYFYIEWQLIAPLNILVCFLSGVLVGIVSLIIGLPISTPQPGQYIRRSIKGFKYLSKHRDYLFFQLGITWYEEIIWRVFLISSLMLILPPWLAVAIASILFWTVHEENRPLGWHSLEFYIFAVLVSIAYVLTQSLLFVWAIHLTRNALILSAHYYDEEHSLAD